MIKSLSVKNIALIQSAEIKFDKGLNVLSGETGSGKTVLIDSINFVLGAKADKTLIRHGESECLVEAVFDISDNLSLQNELKELDVEFDDDLIIKRKYTIEGKGDIKVNGETMNTSMLKRITQYLVDVYGQSEHYSLLKNSNQLKVVDLFGKNKIAPILKDISPIVSELKSIEKEISSMGGSKQDRAMRIDILSYQIKEIKDASLKIGEEEELIETRNLMKNSEKIANSLSEAYASFSSDNAAIDALSTAKSALATISGLSEEFSSYYDRIESLIIEADDLSSTISNNLENLNFDEQLAIDTENRLDLIKSLKKKYGDTVEEILAYAEKTDEELDNLKNYESKVEELTNRKQKLEGELLLLYNKLTQVRKATAEDLSAKIKQELQELGMKSANFVADIKQNEFGENLPVSSNGIDEAEFLFSANLGEPLANMSKIISGGEMSRFMLAMKVVTSEFGDAGTFIFDEIDAGISGKVAETVAQKFAKISINTQIVTISHLPQIVSMSDTSFLIAKSENVGRTVTNVTKLNENDKVLELVRLTGASASSDVAVLNAKEMIQKATEIKSKIKGA